MRRRCSAQCSAVCSGPTSLWGVFPLRRSLCGPFLFLFSFSGVLSFSFCFVSLGVYGGVSFSPLIFPKGVQANEIFVEFFLCFYIIYKGKTFCCNYLFCLQTPSFLSHFHPPVSSSFSLLLSVPLLSHSVPLLPFLSIRH